MMLPTKVARLALLDTAFEKYLRAKASMRRELSLRREINVLAARPATHAELDFLPFLVCRGDETGEKFCRVVLRES